jgi:hypothetical protein
MNEIVQQIVQRVGIPEDKARMAAQVVIEHLKGKLPASISGQFDSYLSGSDDATNRLGSSISGMMGGKKSA